ncbi:MAG TPA: paraquat-inducible protein A [Lacunisphaera sp.]|nr:paraquat-inducible protein A [Lacunisphaera sp.]
MTDSPSPLPSAPLLACPLCGQLHERIRLRPAEIGKCVRCDASLARGGSASWNATLAWVVTGLILWVPANLLPIVTLSQLGNTRESLLITGARSLARAGMPAVGALVAACGIAAPLLLLLALIAVILPIAAGWRVARLGFLVRWLHVFELWSIPEVYLLAALLAFIKLGDVVHAEPAAGLWCHAAMSVALLVAWRRFDPDAAAEALARRALATATR